ncbi:hypothetical protein [Cetobacterium sp.]|uniref:hypothetical protein n=1 Tax=Cetobacterium sp. TaxID=2071632 RepID=UPI002FC9C5C0
MCLLKKFLNEQVTINLKETNGENYFENVLLSGFDSHFFHLDNNKSKLYSISSILTIELTESQNYSYNGADTVSNYSEDDPLKAWTDLY